MTVWTYNRITNLVSPNGRQPLQIQVSEDDMLTVAALATTDRTRYRCAGIFESGPEYVVCAIDRQLLLVSSAQSDALWVCTPRFRTTSPADMQAHRLKRVRELPAGLWQARFEEAEDTVTFLYEWGVLNFALNGDLRWRVDHVTIEGRFSSREGDTLHFEDWEGNKTYRYSIRSGARIG